MERDEAENDSPEQEDVLKNQLSVAFKGLSFYLNDAHPAIVSSSSDGKQEKLILQSVETQDSAAQFTFTNGTSIVFEVKGTSPDDSLSVTAIPAEGFDTVSIPFSVNSSYKVIARTENSLTLDSKDGKFVFLAHKLADGVLQFSNKDLTASLMPFVPEKPFDYASVAALDSAAEKSYSSVFTAFRSSVISQFQKAFSAAPANLSEREVVAYVAEMGARGNFLKAVTEVSGAFKNSSKRTYVSTPYFGNLVETNKKLVAKSNEFSSAINNAIASNSLSVFTENGISDYIIGNRKTEKIKSLMQIPSKKIPFNPSVTEAAGILSVYSRVRKVDEKLVAPFESVLNSCLDVIASHLKLDDGKLIFINEEFSSLQKVIIGQALIDFAKARGKTEFADTGRVLISQEIAGLDSIESIADMYPVIVTDNTFYPHAELLGFYDTTPVWAWTCSSDMSYRIATDGVVSITMDFPLESSQYVIVTGVPTFHSQIEIQNLRFRTDPKFENYNSSGYAYDESKKTLFLKSRHKAKTELIRLFCDPVTTFMGPDDTLASMQQQVQEMGLANVSVKRTEEGLTLSVEKIQFEAESAALRESELVKLRQIAQILKAYPNDIMVSGHTAKSNIGRPAQPLSEERAEAVAEYLIQQGVRTREHIFSQGFGDTRPISPNNTEEERAVNRRVEITLLDN